MLKLILLGVLQITAYEPVPQQTRPGCNGIHACFTADGDIPTKYGAAVSQDLLRSGAVHYGDSICIEGFGCRSVNDTMNKRHRNAVDLMVWTKAEEKKVGVRHLKVYVVRWVK